MSTVRKLPDDDLPRGITVAEFLPWYETRAGRSELHDGDVVQMSAERVGHACGRFRMQRALYEAVRAAGSPCHVLPDGIAVHVSDTKWYEPDAMVCCGPEAPDHVVKVDNPIVVVEVTQPSAVGVDEGDKMIGYFDVPSVQHYLIVNRRLARVIHHKRQSDGTTQGIRMNDFILSG
jgi:Uma2 family endonuclease